MESSKNAIDSVPRFFQYSNLQIKDFLLLSTIGSADLFSSVAVLVNSPN